MFFFFIKKEKERSELRYSMQSFLYVTLCSSVAVSVWILSWTCLSSSAIWDSRCRQWWSLALQDSCGKGSLCIKLLGRSFLIHRSRGFPLTEIIAAFILLPHAVHQEKDEEDGKEKSNNSTSNDGCEARNKREVNCSSGCVCECVCHFQC